MNLTIEDKLDLLAELLHRLHELHSTNTQGFPRSYKLPEKMANSHLYKQAGNSVAVPVVSRIAEKIKLALESEIGGSHE